MKIAVYCSSSNSIAENFKQAAFSFGKSLAKQGHTLVYGGATGGLMDATAEGFSSENGEIIGIIPEIILRSGRESKLPTQLIITADMSERKQKMREIADVFVVLPGGYGTLDEMFDVIAAGTVGEHKKPLFCVNEEGFFDDLLKQIEKMKQEAFAPKHESYKPIFVENWQECVGSITHNLFE